MQLASPGMHFDEPTTSHRYLYAFSIGTFTVTELSTSVGNLAMPLLNHR